MTMANKTWRASLACGAAIVALTTATTATAQQRTFNIPAESAIDSIPEFGRQAGVQITAPDNQLVAVRTPAIKGQRDARQALKELLAGTGLHIISDTGAVIVLHRDGDAVPQGGGANPADPIPAPGGENPEAAPLTDQGSANGPITQVAEVAVTGSHIHGARPIAPVETMTRDDIEASGYSQTGDFVRSIPQIFSGGQNPGIMNTGGGASGNLTNASTVNLRGLGPDATLTLLNGHRLADDGLAQAPDISAIPLAAVDHVEVVTDGASALYGSDAVAGVVNFVLRKNYDGGEASATVGGATQGGGFETDYNALGGKTWSTGHALVSAEYLHQDNIFVHQRDNTAAAPADNTLLGAQNRVSFFGDAGQDLAPWVSARVDAIYSQRQSGQDYQLSATSTAYNFNLKSNFFLVNPGLDFKLPVGWTAALDGSISRSADDLVFFNSAGKTGDTYYRNSTASVEANADGAVMSLPSGPLKLALGAGYRHEGFESNSEVAGASRDVAYVYGEALVPLVAPSKERLGLNSLDLSLAGRIEHYSDFGTTSNPKIALRYVPVEGLALRGTWGTSFKAPTFYQLFTQHNLEYFSAALFGGPTPGNALVNFGGNPDLKPERATSWTAGIDWSPPKIRSLVVSATYFNIDYTGRIALPISSILTALSNPVFAPFVIRNPTAAQLATALASTPIFDNFSGGPYNPAQTVALLQDVFTNVTSQNISGVDLSIKKSFSVPRGFIDVFANATWLDITQQTISTAPAMRLSGTLFNPPTLRLRSGLTWTYAGFTSTGILNYVSSETDTNVSPAAPIGSWTTVDLNLAYRLPAGRSLLSGLEASLAVTNLFDRAPPFAKGAGLQQHGVYFDSTNTSDIGRFVALTVRKRF